MNRVVLGVATVVALSGTASAGSYLGIGIGPSQAVSDDTERLDGIGRSGKILGGFSFGRFAIEGSIGRGAVTLDNQQGVATPYGNLYQASASAKLNFPLGDKFEAFGRFGLQHMRIDASDRPVDKQDALKASGNGFLVGGGFEYKLNLGVGGGSLFLDYTLSNALLVTEATNLKFDTTTRTWTLGITVGF